MDSSTNKFLIPAAVVLAGLFIGGAVVWNGSHPSGSGTGGAGGTQAVDINDVKTAGEPFYGDPNAPVTIAEWSDYQCPFCQQFEDSTLPEIIQNYISAGKEKIVFKDFQFLGPDSMVDAEWARSVWALHPDQFFAWRSAIYQNQPEENSLSAADNLAWLVKTTNAAGLDASAIQADVKANQAAYDAAINADKTEAGAFGISATPSFVVGTQMIAGAYPYATFQQALDAELAK
jgi:protein-disulfide isomerase